MFSNLARKLDFFTDDEAPLTPAQIVRAWEDREYRARLTPAQLKSLPPHPTGEGRLLRLAEDPHLNDANMSSNNCSSNNCSSDNCSSSNCSSDNCSTDNCSSSNCSSNNCSTSNCGY